VHLIHLIRVRNQGNKEVSDVLDQAKMEAVNLCRRDVAGLCRKMKLASPADAVNRIVSGGSFCLFRENAGISYGRCINATASHDLGLSMYMERPRDQVDICISVINNDDLHQQQL
jgi:hypothetical protein